MPHYPGQERLPLIAWPPRRTIVRLDPDLTDSPLRRALAAAGLSSPFGIADGDTEQENPRR